MVAIVGLHCALSLGGMHGYSKIELHLILQLSKFGTICFFLISGFLMGERLPSCNPLDYLRRRVSRIFPPWLVWLSILVAYFEIVNRIQHSSGPLEWHTLLLSIWGKAAYCLQSTAFWFVPNMIVAMCCLLLLRKRLNDLRVGAALFAVDLFYVVNIYTRWFPSAHTEATFGFVFHLWLGAWCALNFDKVQGFVNRLSTKFVVGAIALSLLAGIGESGLLHLLHTPDPMNTLRLTNQLFSVVMTLALFRIRRRTWPRFIDVPSQTYGIYLVHSVVLSASAPIVGRWLWVAGRTGLALSWLLFTAITYGLALLVTMSLASIPGLEWMVGANGKRRKCDTKAPAVSGTMVPAAPAELSRA